MSQSIRKFKNNDELIASLKERQLVFPDNGSKNIFRIYLMQYGYLSFVKKMSSDLMYSNLVSKTFKKEFTSNNLRYLFDIDRNISSIIFKYFRNIEFLLNSSILKVLARRLNKKTSCPYIGALSFDDIEDIFQKIPKKDVQNKRHYVHFYEDIMKNFNNLNFDCKEAIKYNMLNENDEIKKRIEKGWFNYFINKVSKLNHIIKNWQYLDIFSLFQILTFSQLVRIFSYLSTSLKKEVIKEFSIHFNLINKKLKLDEETFKTVIDIFSKLRNVLMHNGSLIKFNVKINENIQGKLKSFFNIEINDDYIKLNETILLIQLVIGINNEIFEEINESIENKLKKRTNRPDKISQIVFDIIKKESRIKINTNLIK